MANTYQTLISVLDKTAAPILAIEERLKHLGAAGHAAQKALIMSPHEQLWHELTEHVMAADELFRGLGDHIHEMGDRLAEVLPMLGGLGAVGSAAGLVELAHAVAEAAEALQNVSKITGVAVPQLQTFDYAAGQVGVSADQLSLGFERLDVRIGRAAEGLDKQSLKLFHKMGITLRDSGGHVKSVADIMPQLEKSFADTQDPALRAAMAMQLFGRSGLDLLPFLNQGPAKIKQVQDEFDKFGYKFSDDDLEGLEKFNQSWKEASLSVEGLKDAIGAALGPVMAPLLTDFATFVSQNRRIIALDLKETVERTGKALENMPWKTMKDDVRLVIHGLEDFTTDVGGLQNVIAIAGGVLLINFLAPMISLGFQIGVTGARMTFFALTQVAQFGTALLSGAKDIDGMAAAWKALGMAFAANPLGALITAMVTIGVLGYVIYTHWNQIADVFKNVGTEIQGVLDKIGQAGKSVTGFLGGDPSSGGFEAGLPGKVNLPQVLLPSQQGTVGSIAVTVDMKNLPPGTKANVTTSGVVQSPKTKKGYSSMSGIDEDL